jgi:outer membrane biosynthesis protein TonB
MAKTADSEHEGITSKIVAEFISRIDTNIDHELKDLKKIMTVVYKELTTQSTQTTHKKSTKTAKHADNAKHTITNNSEPTPGPEPEPEPTPDPEPEPTPDPEPVFKLAKPSSEPAKPAKPVVPEPAPEEESSEDEDAPKKRGRPKKEPKLDKNGVEKAKRKPSSYNNFIQERIEALKKEQSGKVVARVLMVIAASEWKNMTQDQKSAYKK